MVRRLYFVLFLSATCSWSSENARARDLMYEKPVGTRLTYGKIVEEFYGAYVFPPELKYNGVGLSRDSVTAERVETNDRGGLYVTVRARYSGRVLFASVAERVRVDYDNGAIRVDLGGLKGALSTKGIGRFLTGELPTGASGGGTGAGTGGGMGGTNSIGVAVNGATALYDVAWITNNSRALATVYFQTSSGAWKKKVLQRGETTHFYKTRDGLNTMPTLTVRLDVDTHGVHVVEYRMSRGPSPDAGNRSYGHHFELKQLANSDKRFLAPVTASASLHLLDAKSQWPTNVVQ